MDIAQYLSAHIHKSMPFLPVLPLTHVASGFLFLLPKVK